MSIMHWEQNKFGILVFDFFAYDVDEKTMILVYIIYEEDQ